LLLEVAAAFFVLGSGFFGFGFGWAVDEAATIFCCIEQLGWCSPSTID
jgi:hypothetical protein